MIYIFKTSVKTKHQVKELKPHIDNIIPNNHWNFDLDDCDKILRVESKKDSVPEIMSLLASHHFDCKELE